MASSVISLRVPLKVSCVMLVSFRLLAKLMMVSMVFCAVPFETISVFRDGDRLVLNWNSKFTNPSWSPFWACLW
jgi:hypothetical protein